jgi:hypothetical protein
MAVRKSSGVKKSATQENSQAFNTSPEIDQKIDEFIRKYPKQFDYYDSLPKEYLVRAAILKEIRAQRRSERTRSAILLKVNSDPEMKKSIETLVQKLPEEIKRTAMASVASRTSRKRARRKPAGGGDSITPDS